MAADGAIIVAAVTPKEFFHLAGYFHTLVSWLACILAQGGFLGFRVSQRDQQALQVKPILVNHGDTWMIHFQQHHPHVVGSFSCREKAIRLCS